ncbi:ABC transporter ATP-binding protein [Bacterioplanoides sp. SCSIO 12839]|uniref:ABC transporter ATP-binding protein n=1 Tax=Bacterioplanoides sp. SCSIO 12839 TaxID=2829569 RepID=UPI002105B41E|nr:ABC transporter ATP-binding protein [Bacterioplanoides sp. SCSIO 12839]UTW48558.1 ABC transporter ATP-binding protein [Bacterioplanoides sp. SCSIO 12839]
MSNNHNGEVIFSAQNVGVSYKQRVGTFKSRKDWVLRDFNLEIRKGESLAIIGRNGAGKSTLMRLIAGIIDSCEGRITNHARSASLLSLQAGFIPDLSGRENILLSAVLLGLSRTEVAAKEQDIIDYADLENHIDKPVSTYSSGMKARLGFSVAKYANSDMLLIDEVLGVGDDEFKAKSSAAIREMVKSDRTIVFVSHSAIAVKSLCNRAAWLEHGRIVDIGEPERVIDNYRKYNTICRAIAEAKGIPESQVRAEGKKNDPFAVIEDFDKALTAEMRNDQSKKMLLR